MERAWLTTSRSAGGLIELYGIVVGVSGDWIAGSGFEGEKFLDGFVECFVHVGRVLGGSLEERQISVRLAPSADLFGRH